jgi:hypothetical protein
MTTVEQEMAKTDKMVRRVRANTPPQPEVLPVKEPIDWREEFKDDWDYHGIIYTIGKTLAWVLVLSVMFGVIYGSLITEQI